MIMPKLLIALSIGLGSQAVAALDLYVATEGSDVWSGRLADVNGEETDGPFATIERARDEIRKLRKSGTPVAGPVTVYLRGGSYFLDGTFELSAPDVGTKNAPITYRAYKREKVRLIGGRKIAGFTPVTGPVILERIDPAAREKMLQSDLKAQGISDFGEMKSRGFGRAVHPAGLELFFQDKPMTLARWPNEGWVKIVDVPVGKKGGKFTYDGDRPKRWTKADDIWVHGTWTWDWADSYEKVKSIDTAKRVIVTEPPHGVYGYTAGKRFYALNLLEELDEPGEWYLDRKSGLLYFWPPAPIGSAEAFVSVLDTIISMRDVSHVTIRGLIIEVTRATAVKINGGAHNRIAGCTLRNIGNSAVAISGGADNGVIGCDIYEAGDGGIGLTGGDRKTLAPGGNYAVNNHIHHYSRWSMTYRPAVSISGVGNRIAHNLIHDAPHNAIMLHGNEHVIEFNEIHSVCLETDDVGAFYMGRDWTERGNMIRYNYFHHLGRHRGGVGVQAIYFDDWASGNTAYGNICYKAGRAVLIGGGRDNTIENNVFVDCKPAVHVDSRGLGWAKNYFDGTTTTLTDRLNAMNYKQPPYRTRYPKLLTLYEDEPAVAKGNLIARNISIGGKWLDLHNGLDEKIVHVKDNLVGTDPHFVDANNQNFQLKDDSPAYKLGFKRIPVEKIGPYQDELRASWPVGDDVRDEGAGRG